MATRTGTASQVDASAGSGSTSVTVPADATAAVLFWANYNSAGESTFATKTLGGNAFTTRSEITVKTPTADSSGVGVATLTSLPGSGTQTFAWAWSDTDARDEGGGALIVWVKDVNLADVFRDADTDNATGSGSVSVTIDSNSTDLVLAVSQSFGTDPDSTGTEFVNNWTVNSEHYDGAQYTAGASTTTCTHNNFDYSTIAAISLKASAVAATTKKLAALGVG